MDEQVVGEESPEKRPGIFIIGSSNVGKRTLLSRLLSVEFEDASDSSSGLLCYGWTINTKYYTADVSLWMTHLHEECYIEALPFFDQLAALIMVFDINEPSSFVALKDWVARTDLQKFDILLCIGNKVDLLPGHSAHVEYRRRLQKLDESWGNNISDNNQDFLGYGISENEGSSLLGDEEESPLEIKNSCLEWCIEHNIEYVEACASNADFDKCLSVDGDSQGVERIYGALSAHMWPGMILKSGDKINEPSLPENQELSEEESDYEIEYEILSAGSVDPFDDTVGPWVTANGVSSSFDKLEPGAQNYDGPAVGDLHPSTSSSHLHKEIENEKTLKADEGTEPDADGAHYELEDLEKLMSEIGSMRDSLRLMPDFQRRDMAGKLAMKMAAMFGDSSGDEEGF